MMYLIELDGYNPATASVETYRYSSHTGYDNAGTFYAPRIENPGTFSRGMNGPLGGRAQTSWGEITLLNGDGGLNALADLFFEGRTVTVRTGEATAAYASFAVLMQATIETVTLERSRVSIRLRDQAVALDTPFATAQYAGSNVLPAGIEGTADDLKGQLKPRLLGRVALLTPVCVNTSKLIYQVSAVAVADVVNVFDKGAYLARGNDYSSQADMEANAPTGGQYRVWPAGGCFRLGASPVGTLSVCVAESFAYADVTAAGLIQRILTEKGYTAAGWVAADLTTLNQKTAAPLGLVVQDSETTASLLDRICQSVGAWWGFDRLGKFRVARLDAPSGTPVLTLTETDLLDAERTPAALPPRWQVTLQADINHAVQDKSALAGSVAEDRANWLRSASRDQVATSEATKTARLLAETETTETLFNSISQAQAEAARRLALLSARRDTVTVTLPAQNASFTALDLGSVVAVQSARLGYASARLMVVTQLGRNEASNQLDLTLWG